MSRRSLQRQRAVGGDHRIGLRRQYARKHDAASGRGEPPQWRGDAFERPEQNVGEDQVVGRVRADRPRADAVRQYHRQQIAGAVMLGIAARGLHGEGVVVGRQHVRMQRTSGGDRQHAGARADIENAHVVRHPEVAARRAAQPSRLLPTWHFNCRNRFIRFRLGRRPGPCILRGSLRSHLRMTGHELSPPPRLADRIERQQAAARRAVVAGAEGERGFDLDADAIEGNARAVVRAVHDEAAGLDRLQSGETFAHPIGRFDRSELQRSRSFGAGCRGHRIPHAAPALPRCGSESRPASARRRCRTS